MNPALVKLALLSGLLTFLTPCGFAMLPAYVSYHLGRDRQPQPLSQRKRFFTGIVLGFWAGLGIITIFAFMGIIIIALGNAIKSFIPLVTIFGALFITAVGVLMLAKKNFSLYLPFKLGKAAKPEQNFYTFGIIYGLAVMSCSLPIFLAVTLGALSTGGIQGGLFIFSLYAGAAAFSMIVFSLLLSVVRESILRWMSTIFPYFQKATAIIIIGAGIYLIYYQITVNRALDILNSYI